ncbi:hypothetical protein BH10PSE7_BH10PSE7_00620 [soil metagenome]
MKMMKWALLGSAALAVTATSAQADELGALKAQLETLQSRVSQLEAQPQASLPSGYSLLSLRDGSGDYGLPQERAADRIGNRPGDGVTISVVPTADAAPMAEITVSAEIRTILIYENRDFANGGGDDDHLDVQSRTRLNIQGKTDTAVGEVGARVRLQGNVPSEGNSVTLNRGYGWWKFAPAWTLHAGWDDTTAAVQAGFDWDAASGPLFTGGQSDKLNDQLRLIWNNGGPITLAIAVEDSDDNDRGDIPAIVGYIAFDNETVFLQLVGVWQKDDSEINGGGEDDWAVGAGARFALGDMFTISAGGTAGEGYNGYANNVSVDPNNDTKFWTASIGVIFNISDNTRLELGYGHEDYSDEADVIAGGIYWDPVSQVTLGLNAGWRSVNADVPNNQPGDEDDFSVAFGTWLRF